MVVVYCYRAMLRIDLRASVLREEIMELSIKNQQGHKYNCIVLLGMHRSGTSIFANILSKLGVNMGKNLREGDRFNKYGYYERADIKNLNQEILGDWRGIPKQNVLLERALKRKTRIIDMCQRNNQLTLWGWKDPRTCLTVEYWHYYLCNPYYIIVNRKARDIVKSLMFREQEKCRHTEFDTQYWMQLVERYKKGIANFVMKARPDYMMADYDYLTKNPISAFILVSQIAENIGVSKQKVMNAIRQVEYKNEA